MRVEVVGVAIPLLLASALSRAGADWPRTLELPAGKPPPYSRVVLVTVDTLRADHLASYGYSRDVAPFFSDAAARGVRFEHAIAAISHTAPSHATMLTGLAPSQHGLRRNGERLDPSIPTLAGMFARAGWDTAAVTSVGFLEGAAVGFRDVRAVRRNAREVTDDAISLLRERDATRPLFLWIHYYDVHEWNHQTKIPGGRVALRNASPSRGRAWIRELSAMHGWPTTPDGLVFFDPPDWGLVSLRKDQPPQPFLVPDAKAAMQWIDRYDGLLARVDRQIARLFDALAAQDAAGATLAILTSDHGEGLGGHGVLGHGRFLYQEQLHVPLVFFASDGSIPPRTVSQLVSLTDLAPTIAELCGAPGGADPKLAGSSFASLVRAGSRATQPPAFAERRPLDAFRTSLGWQYPAVYSVETATRKYIANEGGTDEFYDLERDPHELENRIRSDDPARSTLHDLLREYVSKLEQSRREARSDEAFTDELRALGYAR